MDTHHNAVVDQSPLAALRHYHPIKVRWTFFDLLGIAITTIVLGALGVAVGQVLLRGTPALQDQPLAFSMGIGGMVYTAALLATFLWIVLRGRGTWHEIGFRSTSPWWVLLIFGIFMVQLLGVLIINVIVQQIVGTFENPQIAALTDERGFSWLNFAVVFVVGAIIAPVVEELVFRGLLYQWLRTHAGVVVAVLLSAAIFSVVHVIPVLLPSLFVVGLILTLAFEWSQSLWVTIALHMFQNGLAIIALYAIQALDIPLPT